MKVRVTTYGCVKVTGATYGSEKEIFYFATEQARDEFIMMDQSLGDDVMYYDFDYDELVQVTDTEESE